jgi:tetratricopeptide (TPR) repeat protein
VKKQIRSSLGRGDVSAADAYWPQLQKDFAKEPDYSDALSWAAYEYRRFGHYLQAVRLYEQLYAMNPGPKVRLRCDEGIARCFVRLGDDARVQEQVRRIYERYYPGNREGVAFYVNAIGEEYYNLALAVLQNGDVAGAQAAFQKAVDLLESVYSTMPTAHYQCVASYLMGLCRYYQKDWQSAADYFLAALEAEPGFQYAGAMHWMIGVCFENLKSEGQVEAEEADAVMEWGYQTVFERYPQDRGALYAAMRLGEMNLARGRPVTACVYFNWILDRAEDNIGLAAAVGRLLEGKEVCR